MTLTMNSLVVDVGGTGVKAGTSRVLSAPPAECLHPFLRRTPCCDIGDSFWLSPGYLPFGAPEPC
jgi:hypothetical protein